MSIANIEPAVSIREIAAAAWQRQQDEQAEAKRQEIEAAEDRLRSEIHRALRPLTNQYDPASPLDHTDVRTAKIVFEASADGIPFAADVSFAGEWWRYDSRSYGDHQPALVHVWLCPSCEEACQPMTRANEIASLADLGSWLEYAPTIHHCRGVAS